MSDSKENHVLQVVGISGTKRAYLDVSREEALRRYHQNNSGNRTIPIDAVKTINFEDELMVLNAWEIEKSGSNQKEEEEDGN